MSYSDNDDGKTPWYEYDRVEEDSPDEDHVALSRAVFDAVNAIEQYQPYVLRRQRDAWEKYLGYVPAAMTWGSGKQSYDRPHFKESRSLVRAGVDTATALIAQHMPKATLQTTAADMTLQRVAQQLDQCLVGAYAAGKVYEAYPIAFRDAAVTGTGTIGFFASGEGDNFRVKAQRIFPAEVVVPEQQCLSGPRDYTERYRVNLQSRRALSKKYGCDFSGASDFTLTQRSSSGYDNVWVIEAIRIVDGDRRKVVVAPGRVLEDIEWPHLVMPYVDLWWSFPASGFYGDGIATRQFAKQARIDYLHQYMHQALQQHLRTLVFNGPAATPTIQQIGGNIHAVVGRSDPKFVQAPEPSPAARAEIEDLFKAGMEEEGISMATAGNYLPPGVDSAPAQQEYSFKEGQRFSDKSQRYETAVAEETARILISMYRHAALMSDRSASLTLTGRDYVTVVDWPDVDIDDDVFKLRIGASSLESLSPAGRQQAVQNLLQGQLIGPVEARLLANHPDLAYMDALALATRRYCDTFAELVLRGELPAIDPDTDLIELGTVLLATYNKAAAVDLRNSTAETRLVLANLRNRLAELDKVKQEKLLQAQQSANAATSPVSGPAPGPVANPATGLPSGDLPGIPPDPTGLPGPEFPEAQGVAGA